MRKGKDPDPDPYIWLMDPDPGGPKHAYPADPDPDPINCFERGNFMFGWGCAVGYSDFNNLMGYS